MYLPTHFEVSDTAVLHGLMRSHPLGAVVTVTAAGLDANHIPCIVHADPVPYGTLHGHVARGNAIWQQAAGGANALVIFQGPAAFVSPSWYASKREHAKVVPTWNYYTVVHAYGALRAIDEPAWVRTHVERLTNQHESSREVPWHVSDAPSNFIDQMVKGIVGIELRISRLTGKWKVSQNRSAADREGVAAALRQEGTEGGRAMADLVRGTRLA